MERRMANMVKWEVEKMVKREVANMVKWEVEKQLESTDAVDSLVSDMKRQLQAGMREKVEREVEKQVAYFIYLIYFIYLFIYFIY